MTLELLQQKLPNTINTSHFHSYLGLLSSIWPLLAQQSLSTRQKWAVISL